ncbi:thiol reductant ABC exporter subunit CydD [Neobacillus sp. YIM B02564]|jgi:ATP-binding cassette subfamily C protein CydD|uniref:Thiol reductant ABC exporter subunit CydD n=1 Tax=Neobacillus paridis TaxID=2803862 RepID=A0ABS1TTE3_9BACI|nr:thiol reductant ABC exporter subunit CydD [Neobacillus paridis]MBL4953818.1 thiol reductant ABC exporter subunit CydD [Neobacillus paridis]
MDKAIFTYKGVTPVLIKLAVLTILQCGMIIVQAYYLANAISSLYRGDLFRTVVVKLIIFLIALVLRQLLSVWKKNISFHFAAHTSECFRDALLQKLISLGPRFIRKEGSGMTVTLVMEGILKFRHYLEIYLIKMMNMAIIPMVIVLFIFKVSVQSAVILVVTLPILVTFLILLGLAAKSKADRQFQSFHLLSNHFIDSLRGLETLKYLGLSKEHVHKINSVSEAYRRATIKTLRIAFLSSFALDFFTLLSVATVAVFLGLGLINGTVQLHPALTILILAPEFFLPIRELGADYHATLDGKNAGKKIAEIIAQESEHHDHKILPVWNTSSSLAIKHVNLQFPDHQQGGLQDIELTVSGPQKIGIIGASGAGKSTLIDLLSGFLEPSSGEFWINGEKSSTLSNDVWQQQVTYIPQHPYIFNDTVLNNIRFYQPEAADDDVLRAAKKAGLEEVIQSLPQGLETVIGDGGRSLSGGQEQRIALARAFLGNRSIIMLDEPTAHLDIETEAELKETMLKLFSGKLVFFATHRLHWMLDMDQIIVLDQGRIVEIGSHEQLIANKSYYYQLVEAQKGDGQHG